jgi:hypothetical protein
MRVEWIYIEEGGQRVQSTVRLWRERGSALVFAPMPPEEGTALSDHHAGEVRLVRPKVWRAVDENGVDRGTAESPAAAAQLLPRVAQALAWLRELRSMRG